MRFNSLGSGFRVRAWISVQWFRIGFRGSIQGKGSWLGLWFRFRCKSLGSVLGFWGFRIRISGLGPRLWVTFKVRVTVKVSIMFRVRIFSY